MTRIAIACTLDGSEQAGRRDEWADTLARAITRDTTATGAHLTFERDLALAHALADLVMREVDCCAFFTFTLTVTHDVIELDVAAPEEARELVAAFACGA